MTAPFHDAELVSSFARGGYESAFRSLVERHVDLVFATALRQVSDRGMAEEITQNVFIALARKAPRLSGCETLGGWLHRTTVLEARARLRSELRRRRREKTAAELVEIGGCGESPFDALLPLLDEALLSLNASDREAIISRFMQERSLRDVGSLLGIGEDAARKRVSRGLDKVARFFQDRGFAIPGTAVALLGAATQTAPPSLAAAALQAGLANSLPVVGFQLLLLNVMNASGYKVVTACLLIIAGPLLWQQRAVAKLDRENLVAQERLDDVAGTLAGLTAKRQSLVVEEEQMGQERARAAEKLAALRAQSAPPKATVSRPYAWDDRAPLARLPKGLVKDMNLTAVRDRRGQLEPRLQAALQMQPEEAQRLQGALDSFLRTIHTAQRQVMRPVELKADDLQGRMPEEVRAFVIGNVDDQLSDAREELFASGQNILGPERFAIFKEALGDWMPLNDQASGINSSMGVFNGEQRVVFRKPIPGTMEGLPWSIKLPSSSMSAGIKVDEIPEMFAVHLQDWIELARRQAAENPLRQN